MAIGSARCDMGPTKQAEPIPLTQLATVRVRDVRHRRSGTSNTSCLLASWWLLREIEASHAVISHITFDWSVKKVDLKLPNSKSDLLALGTSRVHTCSCAVQQQAMSRVGCFQPAQDQSQPRQGWVKTFTEIARQLGLETHWDNGAPTFGACVRGVPPGTGRCRPMAHASLRTMDISRLPQVC